VIFGRVPVLGDENCHGLGKRGKGKEKREKKERRERENRCFVDGEMRPPRMLFNECYVQRIGPNLQRKG
jgi:hypothetical protein